MAKFDRWAELKSDPKKVKVPDQLIIDRMIEDIQESDSDTLIDLIEHMYPVKADYDLETGEVTIVPDEDNLPLHEIF